MLVSTDPPAKLVELREAQSIGSINDDGVGGADIQTGFDDGSAQQNIERTAVEVAHNPFQALFRQLAVSHRQPRPWNQLFDQACHAMDALHAIMNEEDLSPSVQLLFYRLLDDGLIEPGYGRPDREAILRRGLDRTDVPDAQYRHVHRPRDRRCGERQDIDLSPELLHALLGRDAETVLLIHHKQSKVPKMDILLKQAVGTDDDIYDAVTDATQYVALLLTTTETREHLHLDREVAEPLGKGPEMLQGEDSGRDQDRHLLPPHNRLKSSPHRHLGLTISDITADQAVHRPVPLHVGLGIGDRQELARGFLVWESSLEFPLPRRIRREGIPFDHLPGRIQREQLLGHLADGSPDPLLGLGPGSAPQPVEGG